MAVEFRDHSQNILAQFKQNKIKALTAIGEAAVEITTDYMEKKYYHPIHLTGDLIRDVNFQVNPSEDNVTVGNSLSYAPIVHNGSMRMIARPYLRDAILNNAAVYQEVAEEYLGKGFGKVGASMG